VPAVPDVPLPDPLPPLVRRRARPALLTAVLAVACGAGLLAPATPAAAQAVAGLGEDAVPIPRGGFRFRLAGTWDEFARRDVVTDGARRTVRWLAPLDGLALDGRTLPALAAPEAALADLAGDADARLSLGPLAARGIVRRATTRFDIDYGLTRRIGLFARLPYVDARQTVDLRVNPDGTGATAGAAPTGTANATVFGALDGARTALADAIASCGAGGGIAATCDAIAADPGAAEALLVRTAAIRDAWGTLYGGGSGPASPVVPLAGSDAAAAVGATLADLAEAFGAYGIADVPGAVPANATRVFGPASLAELVEAGVIGVAARTPAPRYRAGAGDIAVGATFLAYDSWDTDQVARLDAATPGLRVLGELGWRFGSANRPPSDLAFALPTGQGTGALLSRVTVDAVWTRRLWASATARLTLPQADDVIVRLPRPDDPIAFLTSAPVAARWTPGRSIGLEVAPRYALTEQIGVAARWRYLRTAGDTYAPRDGEAVTLADVAVQQGAIGLTYSTLAPFTRRGAGLPLEVTFTHEVTLPGGSGPAPRLVRDRLELRLYTGFPRR
jgi:hypothetical protein